MGVVSQVVWISSEPCLKLMPISEWGKNMSPQGGNSAGQGEEGSEVSIVAFCSLLTVLRENGIN